MPYPKVHPEAEEWTYKIVETLSGGINLSIRSDRLEDEETLRCENINIIKDRLEVDTGYKKFGDTIAGIPQGTFDYSKTNGIEELILITTLTVYKWDSARSRWKYIAGDVSTRASVGEVAGVKNIRVVSNVGAVVGGRIGITLSDGTEHQTTVEALVGVDTISVVDPIPAGKVLSPDGAVVQAIALDGNLDSQVVALNVASHEWLVFTNGVDFVKRYDGATIENIPGLGAVVARSLALFKNCLFLINTVEEGEAHPRRVRRSDGGDPTEWRDGVGLAGYNDLFDEEDGLQTAEVLGRYLIVYAEFEIIRGEYVGTAGITFDFETMVRGEGVISTYGVADVGDSHIVMCQSNIYEYKGGSVLQPVGDNVYHRIYGSKGSMSPERRHRAFCFYVSELDEVWFFFPNTQSGPGCNELLRYNLGQESWTERKFRHEFIGFGFYESQSTRPWNSLVGSWRQQTWRWNERTILSHSPTTHLCCADESQVMEYDYLDALDDGVAIGYTVETKDFLAPDTVHRFDMLEMGIRGNNVLVQCSTDEGLSWMTLGTATRNTMGKVQMFLQFPFEKVRFRWSGDSTFVLDWFGFSHKDEFLGTLGE